MKPNIFKAIVALIVWGLFLMTGSVLHAQFIVDAAGPRNAFANPGSDANSAFKGFNANLNTSSTPSLDIDYFHGPLGSQKLSSTNSNSAWVWGLDAKVTAANGVAQFFQFNQVPELAFSGIGNWSFVENDNLFSFTARITGRYAGYALFDSTRPAGSQSYTASSWGEDVIGTFSYAPSWATNYAVALSLGYSRTNNYSILPQATLGAFASGGGNATLIKSGKLVHSGVFNTFNAYPITLLPSHNFGIMKWLSTTFEYVPVLPKENDYQIIVSPYVSIVPADKGRPTDSVGINFVLESDTRVTDNLFAKQKTTYPLAIFVDRMNTFIGTPNVTVGAALTYHFP